MGVNRGVNMGKKTGLNRVVNIKHGITLNSSIKLTVFHHLKKKGQTDQRWKKYFPFCEPVFHFPKCSVKLRDFRPYLPCKISQIIVISRQTNANYASYDPSWLRSIRQIGLP